eukprot:Em0015g1266a
MLLYKDSDVVAINKPAGIAVHAGPGLTQELTSYLPLWQYEAQSPPSIAHRLDKDTSGVLLLSRTAEAATRLRRLFEDKMILKNYCAITVNVPEKAEGSIEVPLSVKDLSTQQSNTHGMHRVILRTDKIDMFSEALAGTTLPGGLQLAWTKYNILSSYGRRCSLLDLELVTGFKHQLRAHLADGLTCPVLGDHKFAGPLMRKYPALKKKLQSLGPMGYTKGRMYLHAYQVQIIDYFGVQRPLTIMAPLPPYFVQALKSLGLQIPSKYRNRILSV